MAAKKPPRPVINQTVRTSKQPAAAFLAPDLDAILHEYADKIIDQTPRVVYLNSEGEPIGGNKVKAEIRVIDVDDNLKDLFDSIDRGEMEKFKVGVISAKDIPFNELDKYRFIHVGQEVAVEIVCQQYEEVSNCNSVRKSRVLAPYVSSYSYRWSGSLVERVRLFVETIGYDEEHSDWYVRGYFLSAEDKEYPLIGNFLLDDFSGKIISIPDCYLPHYFGCLRVSATYSPMLTSDFKLEE